MDDIAANLDLDIRIRHRIAAVLSARLDWALLLRHQLHASTSHNAPPSSFKAAARDAITTIESPCNIIFDYPLPAPPRVNSQPARPIPRQKPSGNPTSISLYIRSSTLGIKKDYDEFYLLKCPQCSRTTFTTLQGLLNHARIAHHLEWGTHEECVRACAVIEPGMDTSAGIEVGLGPTGILPGLRSIFQMAVGVQSKLSATQLSDGMPSQITRLLGLHEDTPILAPFLGKDPIRRGIKVYEQDGIISIVGLDRPNTARHWRLPLYPRNGACQQIHEYESTEVVSTGQENVKPPTSSSIHMNSTRSRFHFITRIIVTDRSCWISPNHRERPHQHHSHKWMISVHSPSYAHNLTTILKSLKVTPVHDMGSAIFVFPSPESPPYVVAGTAKSPFLAKIELSFNGIGAAESPISDIQRVVVKHWIELDRLKLPTPVVGEEQTVDVELDKRTLIGPSRNSFIPLGSKVFWYTKPAKLELSNISAGSETTENHNSSEYAQILNRLVSSFPMTRESKTGRIVNVPYRLVQTQEQLQSLNLGRRKAIEWKRAKTLRDAYLEDVLGYAQDCFPIPSVGDTYTWLAENGHFIRPFASAIHTASSTERAIDNAENNQYCLVCGLASDAHSTPPPSLCVDPCERWSETRRSCNSCNVMRCSIKVERLPVIDVKDMITTPIMPFISGTGYFELEIHDLLQVSSPNMVRAVQVIVENLRIPGFCSHNELSNDGRALTERELAPYALLSLVMQSFVRVLVKGGVEILRRNAEFVLRNDSKKKRRDGDVGCTLLTPVHVLKDIMAQKDLVSECLAPLGVRTPKA